MNLTTTTQSGIATTSFGGTGGSEFNQKVIRTIGLRSDQAVDQIQINGSVHGGNGGKDVGSITLGDDEYINRINIRSDDWVDYVNFTTNKKRTIYGGGDGGIPTTLENIRVIAIGGKSLFKFLQGGN